MLFNSHEFILLFLPVSLAVYFLSNRFLPEWVGRILLAAASIVFIGCANWFSAGILMLSIALNYLLSRLIYAFSDRKKKLTLIAGLIINIAVLSHFKYTNFLIGCINQAAKSSMPLLDILLPLGISFYTFQQIAFLVDTYKGETYPGSFLDYALVVGFFPKLAQGPIVQYNDFAPQFRNPNKKRFSFDNFAKGLSVFSVGLAKKVMVADLFGKIVDYGYSHISTLNSFEAVLAILAYTFQLYFDFSGYCDMAAGIGLMFNLELPQNFDSPYKARNIADFWKRWHITLTKFLTKYIYIPLGGNRKGRARTYLNILIVYLVSGLWHGTGYTFILWGVLHGIAMILYRIFQKPYEKLPAGLQWLLTFVYINITWVFFRAGSVSDAFAMIRQVFAGGWNFFINAELAETLLQPTFISAVSRLLPLSAVAVIGNIVALFAVLKLKNATQRLAEFKPTVVSWLVTYVLLVVSILSVSGVSTFLYTNF